MKLFKTQDILEMKIEKPGKIYRDMVLTGEHDAKDLNGILVMIPPEYDGPARYHYHENRECIFVFISGEATVVVEGEKIPVKAGDLLFLAKGEKHTILNDARRGLCFVEFFTNPPHEADWIEAEPNFQV